VKQVSPGSVSSGEERKAERVRKTVYFCQNEPRLLAGGKSAELFCPFLELSQHFLGF